MIGSLETSQRRGGQAAAAAPRPGAAQLVPGEPGRGAGRVCRARVRRGAAVACGAPDGSLRIAFGVSIRSFHGPAPRSAGGDTRPIQTRPSQTMMTLPLTFVQPPCPEADDVRGGIQGPTPRADDLRDVDLDGLDPFVELGEGRPSPRRTGPGGGRRGRRLSAGCRYRVRPCVRRPRDSCVAECVAFPVTDPLSWSAR